MWAKVKHVLQIGLKILKGIVVRVVASIEFFINRAHQTISRWISSKLQTCLYPLDLEQFYLPPSSLGTPISAREDSSRTAASSDTKDASEKPIARTRSYSSGAERSDSIKSTHDAKIEILTISRKEARNLVKQGGRGTYLLRYGSDKEPILVVYDGEETVYNVKVHLADDGRFGLGTIKYGSEKFYSLHEVVRHHSRTPLKVQPLRPKEKAWEKILLSDPIDKAGLANQGGMKRPFAPFRCSGLSESSCARDAPMGEDHAICPPGCSHKHH